MELWLRLVVTEDSVLGEIISEAVVEGLWRSWVVGEGCVTLEGSDADLQQNGVMMNRLLS